MLFVEYPKCSTCKKALKFLEKNNIQIEKRNIISDKPTMFEIRKWLEISNKDINKFYNTSGAKYKELNLKDNLKELSFDQKVQLLTSDVMLIKRPILVSSDFVLVGFKEAEWEEKLGRN